MRIIGQSPPRRDGAAKVTGAALYVDDLHLHTPIPGLLHGRTIRSTMPHACIKSVRFDPQFDWSGFTRVTAKDIPGDNVIALIEDDQPCLADGFVRHTEEPVVLLAHEDPEALLRAASAVHIEYDPLPAVLTVEDSLALKQKIHKGDNVFKAIRIVKGDLARGFAVADRIVEGTYHTGHQEQLYIENNGMIAIPERDGGMRLIGSLQCPYYVHKALKRLLKLPPDKVRVVQATTGGGFGGKEEYPSMIGAHAALLALKAGRPVKMVYDRLEDMAATTKRHPSVVRHRTGVTRDGRLTAMEIDVVMDGGAYCTLSPVVLSRGALHAAGPYRCDHISILARAVATHTPPNGAFRGFGAPQTLFAVECHMDRIARELGIEPAEFRRRNLLRSGDSTATGQVLRDSVAAEAVLDAALRRSGYTGQKKKHDAFNKKSRDRRRGIGLSLFYHGAGFTGSGEVRLASKAALELDRDGRVRVLSASTEIGQGTKTIFPQMVAETLGMPLEDVRIAEPDTSVVPDSGPTVASRTTMVVGGLLRSCAEELRSRLAAFNKGRPWTPVGFAGLARRFARKDGPRVIERQYIQPSDIQFDEQTYRGDAYGAYAWSCDVADVEVDLRTGETKVLAFTSAVEVGRAVNPVLLSGQIEGGIVQGLGYALLEEVVMRDGRMANSQLTNYIIPTSMDTPPIDVILLEEPYRHGPFGAKGIGELPIDGPAPAVVAAVRHATGARIDRIPITPERLLAALETPGGTR